MRPAGSYDPDCLFDNSPCTRGPAHPLLPKVTNRFKGRTYRPDPKVLRS